MLHEVVMHFDMLSFGIASGEDLLHMTNICMAKSKGEMYVPVV